MKCLLSGLCLLAGGFPSMLEQLPNTIKWRVMELQSGAKLVAQCVISKCNILVHWLLSCHLPTLHCTVIGLTRERFVALGLPS